MNTQIGYKSAMRQSTRRFSFRALALAGIWLVLVSIYATFVIAVATAKVSNAFIVAAIFSGAILCASLDRSRIALAVAVAIPLFGLAEWLRTPALSDALLTLGCGGVILLAYYAASGNRIAGQNLLIAVLLPLFVVLTNVVNDKIAHVTPNLFDAVLLRADCGIGAAIRHWTLARPLRLVTTNVLYGALPLVASGVIAHTTGRARSQLLRALCFAALLAVPCYLLFSRRWSSIYRSASCSSQLHALIAPHLGRALVAECKTGLAPACCLLLHADHCLYNPCDR